MTRAPRSASWRVANGAATACSSATTIMPSRGSFPVADILEGPRQFEDVLGDVGEDEVRRDRGYLIEACLPELALDVVLGVEAVAPKGLHRDVGRLPTCIRCQKLRHVRLRPARLARIKERGGFFGHEIRGLDGDMGSGYRELDALVLADRTPEDLALPRPIRRPLDEE